MNIEQTLTQLKGCQIEFDGSIETLNEWRFAQGLYTLKTSKKERRMDVVRMRDYLETVNVISKAEKGVSILGKQEVNMITSVNESFMSVKDMVLKNMENMNSGKFSKDDLERAKATNEGAKVLIDMAKVQVEMVKELRK